MRKKQDSTEKPQNRQRKHLRVRLRKILLLSTWIILGSVSIVSGLLSWLVSLLFHYELEISSTISYILITMILGGTAVSVLGYQLLGPIVKLAAAMNTVAAGDFTPRLTTKSSITEVQDLYRIFNLMVQDLAATEMLQSDFISNVSHEFKTPINAIEGYATLLCSDGNVTPEQKEYAGKILYNTGRLSGLVGNILLLSKVENQTIPSGWEAFSLDEQLRQAVVALEEKWTEKDIDLEADLEEIEYLGNEQLLSHVWMNLLDNAIKFTPRGGSVRLRALSSEKNILVTVEDTGCGFPEENSRRLFEKFYQAESSHQREGNGLGLPLAKQIVDLHHGTITAENCPAGGSKFIVVLPIGRREEEKH